jgi:hypothetical protein
MYKHMRQIEKVTLYNKDLVNIVISINKRFSKHLKVIYGTSSFNIRLLMFVLNVLWEACRVENGSSFHSFGPEYDYILQCIF